MQNFLNLKLSRSRDSLVSQRKFNELSKNLNLTDTLIEQRNRFEMNKTSQRKKLDFYISQSCYAAKLWWYFIQSDGIFLQSYWTCKICKVFKKKKEKTLIQSLTDQLNQQTFQILSINIISKHWFKVHILAWI